MLIIQWLIDLNKNGSKNENVINTIMIVYIGYYRVRIVLFRCLFWFYTNLCSSWNNLHATLEILQMSIWV